MQTFEKDAVLDERVDGIYRALGGKIQWGNLVPTCIEVAKEIEGIEGLHGPEKLDLLQKVLRHALGKTDKSETEKEGLLLLINSVLPLVVQAAILASKNPVVAQVKTACMGCCARF